MDFSLVTCVVAIVAGTAASISGFGIGSLLTPLLAVKIGTQLAVAAVSIPHLIATAVRCSMLYKEIDKRVLVSFGITSAAGGLSGALLHNCIRNQALTLIFAIILIFAGVVGLTGLNERLKLSGWVSLAAGGVSGAFGGLVGNQGGIRSAALLSFDLEPKAFVATATAIGIVVDLARMPVYLVSEFADIKGVWELIAISSFGVLVGTFLGTKFLKKMPAPLFKRVVSGFILALGIWMLFQPRS